MGWRFPVATGDRFGKWAVVQELPARVWSSGYSKRTFLCRCECGTERQVDLPVLRSGGSKSCGCMTRELSSRSHQTHGLSYRPLFKIWRGIINRCKPNNGSRSKNYGDRGICVSPEWQGLDGASRFIAWAEAHGYHDSLEIDRTDNDGDYSPSNCRWVTRSDNCNNRRSTIFVEFQDRRMSFKQFVDEFGRGMPYGTAHTRLRREFSLEEVLSGRKCRHRDPASCSSRAVKR